MSNINRIKPYFVEDILQHLQSVYYSLSRGHKTIDYRLGVVDILAAQAILYGINPESILTPEDIQLLRNAQQYTERKRP